MNKIKIKDRYAIVDLKNLRNLNIFFFYKRSIQRCTYKKIKPHINVLIDYSIRTDENNIIHHG